jgi:hypothetical protein
VTRRLALALSGALALTGCTGTSDDEPGQDAGSAAPATAPLTGELRQFRGNAAQRLVQITLRPTAPLTVASGSLSAEGFRDGPLRSFDVTLPAGAVIDLPVEYGAADCRAAPGPARAVLSVLQEGAAQEVELPLDDRGLVARLHEAECAEQALGEQVRFTVVPGEPRVSSEGRPALPATLRLTRTAPGDRVVVSELGAHIVFSVRPERARTPLLVLEADEQTAEAELELVPTRCEPHALAENKRMGLLGIYAGLGDAEPRLTTVVPDDATRARLTTFAVEGCRG